MRRFTLLVALFTFIISISCASPPSFCKCTCFTNSTIIELTPKTTPPTSQNIRIRSSFIPLSSLLQQRAPASAACSQCNRAFCIAQNLPICKNAEEKDIFTICFQRDSRKDQIIVVGFVCTTLGLLGWAAVREVLERGRKRRAEVEGPGQGRYAPVG